MNGRIIVTIRMDSFQRDMELPEALPLRTLCVQLLELLKQADARQFRTMDEIALAVDSMPMLNDIKVVRRLVEHDDIGLAEQRLRKQHLDLQTRVGVGHEIIVQLHRDAEALQKL